MSEIVKILTHTVDLRQTLEKTDLHTLFVMGDNQAHRFEIEILSGGKAADLSGSTVTGYFTNFKEDTTIMVDGSVEDGKAVVTLSKPCYTLHGQFVLTIQIKSGEVEDTVFLGEGFMRRTKGETIIHDDYIVYDVSTLLAQISAMKTATENANAAAGRAPYIGGNGNWYVWDAAKGVYADSGHKAQGPKGDQGDVTQDQFNQLSQQKVNYSDALTLEEIEASTDLTGKIPAASALAQVVENQMYTFIGDSGQSNNFSYDLSTLIVPAGVYEFIGGVQFALLSRNEYGTWIMIKALNESDTSSLVDNQLSLYMGTWFGKCYYKRLVDA